MSKFYIKKVTAKGSGMTNSSIDLQPGLNIIKGRSNTGKAVIIKCINFCFGSKEKPFDESFGYTTIEISPHTLKGDIDISIDLIEVKKQTRLIDDVNELYERHTGKTSPIKEYQLEERFEDIKSGLKNKIKEKIDSLIKV